MKYTIKAFILAIAAMLAGCARHSSDSELLIRIGSAAPLTGPQSHLGKDNDDGVRMAADDLNAKGVVIGGKKAKVVILSEDDQADPRTATIVAQKFVDEEVAGVIGHFNSGTSIPASRIYSDAGIPQISPSATATSYTHQGFRTTFRVVTNDNQQGQALSFFATGMAKRIAIIDDSTAYGRGIADRFEKDVKSMGASVVAHEYTNDHATDFTAILTSIKGKQPDLLFYGGMDAQAGPMMRQLRNLGLNVPFLGADGSKSPEFIRLAGGAAEGAYASAPGIPIDSMPGGADFEKRFNAKYGKIQLYSPYSYDATMAMVSAMEKAGSIDPTVYLPYLAKSDYSGVTGRISFDRNGDILKGAVTIFQVKGGNWKAVSTL